MKEKILASIKDHSFCQKLKNKFRSYLPIYWLDNSNVRMQQEIWKTYKKFSKKYSYILKNTPPYNTEWEFSDKIWICWLQGEEHAPELIRACINSVRNAFPNKQIIVVNETNIYQYINFPDYIWDKRAKGIIPHAQFSDLLRVELLCTYGGLWLDATVLVTSPDEIVFDSPLFVYKNLTLSKTDISPIVASSWLIQSCKEHPILLLTRNLMYRYWEENNSLINYFIMHIFFTLATEQYPELWTGVPMYNNHSPHTLQFEFTDTFDEKRWNYLKSISQFHKLSRHLDYTAYPDSYNSYIIKKYGKE